MSRDEVTSILQVVFRDVFQDDELIIGDDTTAEDVPTWDSLTNIQMVLAVEQAFRIRLTAAQVSGLENVGDLISVVEAKVAAKAA